jgi:hypothetical protein
VSSHVGQQGDGARSLYGVGQRPLVLGTGARDTAGYDFAPLGDKVLETLRIFIIDNQAAVCTEAADFSSMEKAFFLPRIRSFSVSS